MIVEAARKYLGVKFRHQGRSRATGVDCAGLVICTLRDIGMTPADSTDYNMTPDPVQMLSVIVQNAVEIPVADMMPGDVLWMRFATEPQHVAIVTENGIIHSYSNRGKVVEHALNDVWCKRIVKCFRVIDEQC